MWLMPAISSFRPSSLSSIPRDFKRFSEHTCTLWHRPTVFTLVYRSMYPVSMAMGLV